MQQDGAEAALAAMALGVLGLCTPVALGFALRRQPPAVAQGRLPGVPGLGTPAAVQREAAAKGIGIGKMPHGVARRRRQEVSEESAETAPGVPGLRTPGAEVTDGKGKAPGVPGLCTPDAGRLPRQSIASSCEPGIWRRGLKAAEAPNMIVASEVEREAARKELPQESDLPPTQTPPGGRAAPPTVRAPRRRRRRLETAEVPRECRACAPRGRR